MEQQGGGGISGDRLRERLEQIREVYLADRRPWILGYSGGKDSTTALQLVWSALAELPEEQRQKRVYVISSDTLVETPKIVDFIDSSLDRMNQAAQEQGMPISAHKVEPEVNDSFWVNLLGRGYPAPSNTFRWCTERLKIDPANKFILDRAAEHGEVVVILGVRRAESTTRAQVMKLHRIKGTELSRHTTLPNAYVYTPVEDFSVDDVWTYLLQWPSPWGNNNRDLVTLYRNAQDGECPLVVDTTTPSCGNSRFGCWVCTVVARDKSMEAMIDNGEDWMEPLLDFRDLLAETQDPARKAEVRRLKRRNGKVMKKTDGNDYIRGPYRFEFRQELLRRLLQTQKKIRSEGPNPRETLIQDAELKAIRRLWRAEEQDWDDSLPKIYEEETGEKLTWVGTETASFGSAERQLLDQACAENDVTSTLVAKLIDTEKQFSNMSRRSAIFQKLSSVLDEEWRTEEEILSTLDEDKP